MKTRREIVLLIAVCLPLTGTLGASAPARYTNADLEGLPPLTEATFVPDAPRDPAAEEAGWRYVADYLEREHARVEAARLAELELLRLAEAQQAERGRESNALPLGWLGCGFPGGPFCAGGNGHGLAIGPRWHRVAPSVPSDSRHGLTATRPFGATWRRSMSPTTLRGPIRFRSGADAFPR